MGITSPIIVLASSSPRRSDLLKAHGIPFEIVLPEVEEISDSSISPVVLVQENARMKARDVANRMPDRIVVGADTVVAFTRTAEERRGYLDRIQPFDKAGSYSAQSDEGFMIREVRGLLSNVVGLPVEKLLLKLADFTNT